MCASEEAITVSSHTDSYDVWNASLVRAMEATHAVFV